ncbi:DUF1338-domain-containing protein [Sporormia fimetaria CBS 119925]|uniref:2-oxoadipate dioxygenase/decarboxylase n=1 Tax=Sporormia fimetaria CBS 119925 TaxID=1340428 RepID=A0A6A6VIL9_9PLEO|nr:DUF1338-domain-containing protein [Sporormia fimetaria CBS 119925]
MPALIKQSQVTSVSWDADGLRTKFTHALSAMYRTEVPLYGKLVEIVQGVDRSTLAGQGQTLDTLPVRHQLERHGAIRLGTEYEMRMTKRLFAIMGMHPVGYYDLKMVRFPLHGTAFRPTSEEALRKNPFRVFTTVLRPELISSAETRELAMRILRNRKPDIVCFPSAHINHLTPRTLDIDAVQEEMIRQGMPAKDCIEEPPKRKCPILLRQTSFKALDERVMFGDPERGAIPATHTARFSEVEQRGAAVTRKGRTLYDRLLASAVRNAASSNIRSGEAFRETSREFPDDWTELRKKGLVFFRYRVAKCAAKAKVTNFDLEQPATMDALLESGTVECEPITYEDFLPFSAAGIFMSNLGNGAADRELQDTDSSSEELERVLGCAIPDEIDQYERLQRNSVRECCKVLGLKEVLL